MKDENYSQYQYQSIRYTWAKQESIQQNSYDLVELAILEQEELGFPEVNNVLDYIKGM